jgi:hypothetical protein
MSLMRVEAVECERDHAEERRDFFHRDHHRRHRRCQSAHGRPLGLQSGMKPPWATRSPVGRAVAQFWIVQMCPGAIPARGGHSPGHG